MSDAVGHHGEEFPPYLDGVETQSVDNDNDMGLGRELLAPDPHHNAPLFPPAPLVSRPALHTHAIAPSPASATCVSAPKPSARAHSPASIGFLSPVDGGASFYVIGCFVRKPKQSKATPAVSGGAGPVLFYDVAVLMLRAHGEIKDGDWLCKQTRATVDELVKTLQDGFDMGRFVETSVELLRDAIVLPAHARMQSLGLELKSKTKSPLAMFREHKAAGGEGMGESACGHAHAEFLAIPPTPAVAVHPDLFALLFFTRREYRGWWFRKGLSLSLNSLFLLFSLLLSLLSPFFFFPSFSTTIQTFVELEIARVLLILQLCAATLKRFGCTMPPERQISHLSNRWALRANQRLDAPENRQLLASLSGASCSCL